ncbi:hypothetical protein BZA05DRAFT_420873 [Tricharina praecox]|uniref:uncharacterized protein n=1 Tax=Tricharina praecox TaxID=43433 RepID=UPI00221F2B43|nr:uncharacterized protein BZA05DRAFT_420873 [Tricharina praecox]KAI5846689.1 hypothetical protein BZA05DRAFT_420873 [Tricharina praecox]
MLKCDVCFRYFETAYALSQHSKAKLHNYCDPCDRYFGSEHALRQHRENSSRHVQEFRCTVCNGEFACEPALLWHQCVAPPGGTAVRVRTPAAVPTAATEVVHHNNFCTTCERQFRTEEAYEQHMASVVHKPVCEDLSCPSCQRTFVALSAFVHHLESGGCAGGATKRFVDRAMMAADPIGVLVAVTGGHVEEEDEDDEDEDEDEESGSEDYNEASRNEDVESDIDDEWGTEDDSDSDDNGVVIFTPTSSSRPCSSLSLTLPTRLDCRLCPDRPAFINARALEQHMASAVAHAPRIYHCPTAFGGGRPEKSFRAASAVIQHLEAEACRGGWKTLNAVVQMLNKSLKKSIGLDEVRLLKGAVRSKKW